MIVGTILNSVLIVILVGAIVLSLVDCTAIILMRTRE
jgi:hypothetical protein